MKYPFLFTYIVDVVIVCFRHDKSVIHLLAHFALCLLFYWFFVLVEKTILQQNVSKKNDPLELTEKEKQILQQLHEGKKQKEIEGYAEGTVSKILTKCCRKNNCVDSKDLIFRYKQEIAE